MDRKLILIVLGLTIVEGILILLICGVRTTPDSAGFVNALEDTLSGDCRHPKHNLRPLGILFAIPFTVFGKTNAFGIESFIFQLIIIPFLYLFSKDMTGKKDIAFLSTILFVSSPLILFEHVFVVVVDMGTWCIYLVTVFFYNREFKREKPMLRNILIISFLAGAGVLIKENAGAGIIFMFFMILSGKKWNLGKKEKFKFIMFAGLIFLIPILINQLVVYINCDYTYYDWLKYNQDTYPYTLKALAWSVEESFGILFLFAAYEYFHLKKYQDRFTNSMMLSIFIPFFLWSAFTSRFLFIGLPVILPLSAMGIKNLSEASSRKLRINQQLVITIILALIIFINSIFFLPGL